MAVTMNARWDNNGTVIPGGDAEYVVAEQPIAEYDNWFNYNIVADIQAVIDDVINKFNANTILKADTDNTPAALVVAEQTIVGRKTGNSIAALIDTEVLAIIGVEAGATADQTNTEIRDAVEAAADSNTFTNADHAKLNGIEPAADVTDVTNVAAAGATMESLFDVNTILKADSNDTPAALTVAEQTLVGRITAGVITALTASQVRTLISVADGADVTGDNAPKSHGSTHLFGEPDFIGYGFPGHVELNDALVVCNGTGWTKRAEATVTCLGGSDFIIISYHSQNTGNQHFHTKIYINSIAVGTDNNQETVDGWHQFTEEFDFVDGDTIELWSESTDPTASGEVKELRISCTKLVSVVVT